MRGFLGDVAWPNHLLSDFDWDSAVGIPPKKSNRMNKITQTIRLLFVF